MSGAEMDLPRVMDILGPALSRWPLRVRIGGFPAGGRRSPSPAVASIWPKRTFSVQGEAFVLMGWPADSLARGGPTTGRACGGR